MVFDRPQQLVAARASVDCFFSQRWPNKELVVFNATPYPLTPWWRRRRAREIRLKPRQPGEMLAICAENANGEWCVNWQPDCWYHPDYLSMHMRHREKSTLVLFQHQHVYSLRERELSIASGYDNWSFYRHFPIDFVNKVLVEQFPTVMRLDCTANLIVKFAREII